MSICKLYRKSSHILFLDGWKHHSGSKSYYNLQNSPKSWNDARKYCQSVSGDLASVPSSEVNSFLTTLTQKPAWIGGYKSGSSWKWTDGSIWSYTKWGTSQPNGASSGQDKLELNFGGVGNWNDREERYKFDFICQIRYGND